jgi:hypothetical protein
MMLAHAKGPSAQRARRVRPYQEITCVVVADAPELASLMTRNVRNQLQELKCRLI